MPNAAPPEILTRQRKRAARRAAALAFVKQRLPDDSRKIQRAVAALCAKRKPTQ